MKMKLLCLEFAMASCYITTLIVTLNRKSLTEDEFALFD